MSRLRKTLSFAADRSGTVTMDWVALAVAAVVIGVALVYGVFQGVDVVIQAFHEAL